MGTKGRILLHLAAAFVGWGFVQWHDPAPSDAEQPIASGKSSIREARDREPRDREAGEALLRRLVPDLAPAPPLEVLRHEGTLEERAFHAFLNDTFPANPGTPGDHVVIDYLRDQIEETLSGRQGPDLSYAFRHGGLDADRILASLRERFPDLVNEPQFPRAVFLELFEIEPARAAVLLDGLDAAERTAWLMDGFRMRSESEDLSQPVWIIPAGRSDPPPVFLAWTDLAVSIRWDDLAMFSGRAMGTVARQYWDQYGSDYTNWLFDQPPTEGRERLLNALVNALELDEPEAGAALEKRLSNR